MIEPTNKEMFDMNSVRATERIVILTRDLRVDELEAGVTLKSDGYDYQAYKEWHPNFEFPYAHRRFDMIDGGWESIDVPGPALETLPLKWGTKKGNGLIMVTRNRPWGDGGASWGTKWRLPSFNPVV